MTVFLALVTMPVGVSLARRRIDRMFVLVMSVVHVEVGMLHRFVLAFVGLGWIQLNPTAICAVQYDCPSRVSISLTSGASADGGKGKTELTLISHST